MRHGPALLGLVSLFASAPLGAQSIRGTVVDDGSKLPVSSVLITMLDAAGTEILPGVRSDSLGSFIIHAARAGTWRVKAVRIGYSPVTSDPVSLAVGGLAVVRLRMTTVAQQLVPVQVIERRQLSASELMSTTGFDLRESRGQGRFLSGERLTAMGRDAVGGILASQFQPTLYVFNDPVLGDVLHIRQGAAECLPEVFLDGRLLATALEPAALIDGPVPQTAFDSMRAQLRVEADQARRGSGQMYALALLSSLTANTLYGIEVYRANDLPPVSLGAWFGMTRAAVRPCGTVAVWTKAGAQSVVAARHVTSSGRAVQVVSGTLVDFDTGTPIAGRRVSLLSDAGDPIGKPVVTDDRGDFTMRTGRAGELRLTAGGDGYLTSTSPPFRVSANELVVVKLFVSARDGLLAPLGVAARVTPQSIGLASLAGFTYRRERAQGGAFFRALDIERTGAGSLANLVRAVEGVAISDAPAPGTIVIARPGSAPRCAPVYYLDGTQLTGNVETAIASLPLNRIFGVEVYTKPAEIPGVFSDAGGCGLIVIWTRR